jgi:hypothetical protein
MKPITLHYSKDLIRKAVIAFWWRVIGWRYLATLVLLSTSLIYLLAVGDRSWVIGVVGFGFALGVIFAAALYVIHYRASLARFRRMRSSEAIFEPGAQTFRISSGIGSVDLTWSAIKEIWCFPDFWLFFFSPAQFNIIPLADLDSEAREFILGRLRSQGIKIV